MNPAFFAAFFSEFFSEFENQAPVQPSHDPAIGREFSVNFSMIIPTAPEGFSNVKVAASQVCSYAPGMGRTLEGRQAIAARELEALRNTLTEEGERIRMAHATGAYVASTAVGATPSRRRR